MYLLLYEKPGALPWVYIGSGTDANKGISVRLTYHRAGLNVHPSHIPSHIKTALNDGYCLTRAAVLVHCPIPTDKATQEVTRGLIITLEAVFTAISGRSTLYAELTDSTELVRGPRSSTLNRGDSPPIALVAISSLRDLNVIERRPTASRCLEIKRQTTEKTSFPIFASSFFVPRNSILSGYTARTDNFLFLPEVADGTKALGILTEAKLVSKPAFDKSLERLELREDSRDFHLVADTKQHYNKDSDAY